jgi:hypothetical protein
VHWTLNMYQNGLSFVSRGRKFVTLLFVSRLKGFMMTSSNVPGQLSAEEKSKHSRKICGQCPVFLSKKFASNDRYAIYDCMLICLLLFRLRQPRMWSDPRTLQRQCRNHVIETVFLYQTIRILTWFSLSDIIGQLTRHRAPHRPCMV